MSDSMVKKEACHSFILTVEVWNGFIPIGEVINNHNDVFMASNRRRVTGHEFNRPLVEGTDYDDMM